MTFFVEDRLQLNDNTPIALAMIHFETVLSGLVAPSVHQRKHQDLLETGPRRNQNQTICEQIKDNCILYFLYY